MDFIKKYIGDIYLNRRFYLSLALAIVLFLAGYFIHSIQLIAVSYLGIFIILVVVDYILLFITKNDPWVKRITSSRYSIGDHNSIEWLVKNTYPFTINLELIDELPEQFQLRDWHRNLVLLPRQQKKISWSLQPLQRGEYYFGNIYLYVSSPLRLLTRRFTNEAEETVAVYPAYMHLHKYEILSTASTAREAGSSKMRKIGQSMEFEQIKEYVSGDDIRTLNWKASARKGGLMVNNYMEERSQQMYCIIDKGRLMKMPFDGLTLLDYAINSCLILSNVCLKKQDRIGLITFSNTIGSILPADRKPAQLDSILQLLYKQETEFPESDFELLYQQVRNKIKHRSLLILFTNFETMNGLHRQIEYLRMLSKYHLLVVVFFENTELNQLTHAPAMDLEGVYIKTIAEKFAFEKRLIAKELNKYGILTILTTPQNLTVNTINKYLDIKTRQAL